jgi:hypothetical protein
MGEAQALTRIHPDPHWFTIRIGSMHIAGPPRPALIEQPKAQSPFASWGVTRLRVMYSTTWEGVILPSSLLWAYASVPIPLLAYGLCHGQGVFAGCGQPLAGRRTFPTLFCESVSMCLDPYPGCSWGAYARFFPQDIGLPYVRTRSALCLYSVQRLQARCAITGLQSFASLQAHRFARHPSRSYRSSPHTIAHYCEFRASGGHSELGSRGFSV